MDKRLKDICEQVDCAKGKGHRAADVTNSDVEYLLDLVDTQAKQMKETRVVFHNVLEENNILSNAKNVLLQEIKGESRAYAVYLERQLKAKDKQIAAGREIVEELDEYIGITHVEDENQSVFILEMGRKIDAWLKVTG